MVSYNHLIIVSEPMVLNYWYFMSEDDFQANTNIYQLMYIYFYSLVGLLDQSVASLFDTAFFLLCLLLTPN